MFKNYFKMAQRNLIKNKVFSAINIIGLAVGLGAFLLIFQFVSFEQSYDSFHEQSDDLYRIQFERVYADKHDKSAGLTAGAGPALKEDFPEVLEYTKLWDAGFMSNLLTVGDQAFLSKEVFYADEQFFQLFSFEVLEGDREKMLEAPNTMAISRTEAMNYFGRLDVIGESIRVDNGMGNELYQVSGVFEDLPANTHFDFEILLSFQTLINATEGNAGNSFNWNAFPTYLKLAPGTDHKSLESKFPGFADAHYAELMENGVEPRFYLQPLEDIYLKSNLRFEVGPTGNARVVDILLGVGLFILILAYFNYINLSTAKSMERAKEIGVRKVSGATRISLMKQFLTESLLLNFISILLGFTLMQLSVPYFEVALDRPLSEMVVFDQSFVSLILVLLIGGTMLSGFYPAWILSRTRTIKVLKGQKAVEGSDGVVRKGLVVLQFAILCFLLVGSLAVKSQIDYMLGADWGFDSEQMVVVNGPSLTEQSAEKIMAFKNVLRQNANVAGVSNTTMIPGDEIKWVNNNVRLSTQTDNEITSMPFLGVDETYLDNLDLELLAGRNFDKELTTDRQSLLLSRAAALQFGFQKPEDALDKFIHDGGTEGRVVGVVENFMQGSFKDSYVPIIYRYVPLANNYLCVKISGGEFEGSIELIEETFRGMFPESTFTYFFLDEFFQRQFKEDQIFGRVFNFFTVLGIWISILGLVGLTSYVVLQRRKEIGIRKVLGASIQSVILLISKRFILLTLLAVLVALPLAFIAMSSWLDSYSFATGIKAYVFVVPVVLILCITLLITGVLSLRTASRNPVEALRHE